MKKLLGVAAIMLVGGACSWNLHHQVSEAASQRARLEREIESIRLRGIEATHQTLRLEAEWSTLPSEPTHSIHPQTVRHPGSTPEAESGREDSEPGWKEDRPFAWIQKSSLRTLGLTAFRATDSADHAVSPELMRLLNRVGQKFAETHPEFARLQDLSPEEAIRAAAEYKQALADATSSLDPAKRRSVDNILQSLEQLPVPGRMSQPPAEYQLNQDVAAVLGLGGAESEAINQLTRDIVQRYHALEQMHIASSDDHSPDSIGRPAPRSTFKVTAFPEEGRLLREEWTSQLGAIVGVERVRYLLEMSAGWIRSDLGDFGEAERTVTFSDGRGSYGLSDRSSRGYSENTGTGGPAPIPPGWRHLIARPPEGGPPALRN